MSVSNKWARIEELCVLKNAFSLMEMMVVLLIVAILAAATAPMVTKKMARNAGSGDSPWVYTGLNNSIAFNMNGNDDSPVIIGASSLPAELESKTRLFIDSGDNASHIAFGNGNATPIGITADPTNGRIGISNQQVPNTSVAFGTGQEITNSLTGIVAIGQSAKVYSNEAIVIGKEAQTVSGNNAASAIAIGQGAIVSREGGIAIGHGANTHRTKRPVLSDGFDIAIGNNATASGGVTCGNIAIGSSAYAYSSSGNAIAIGERAQVNGRYPVAIGYDAKATGWHSVAIGYQAEATASSAIAIGSDVKAGNSNEIVLGGSGTTVHIPGKLVVDGYTDVLGNLLVKGNSYLCTDGNSRVYMRAASAGGDNPIFQKVMRINGGSTLKLQEHSNSVKIDGLHSDRRLKNVGEKYTAGLDELKKLDFFHYTFKKDEDKTPHVGVMAQDLQKVFPDAVTEGDDGYLKIRLEDMFYAVINAVKELDTKITQIVENVTSLSKKVDEQEKIIAEQQKLIEELQAQNANIEKRLAKVEKKSKKAAE